MTAEEKNELWLDAVFLDDKRIKKIGNYSMKDIQIYILKKKIYSIATMKRYSETQVNPKFYGNISI